MAKPKPGQSRIAAGIGSGPAGAGTETMSQLDFSGGVSIYSGNGPGPKLVNGDVPDVGDIWIRTDGGVGSTFYRCTTGGANPVWLALSP